MKFNKLIKLHPKKFTEECVLISVYFTFNRIKDNWFLNYINVPGGAWQELKILKDQIEQKFYIGKKEKRADLVMQKENATSLFYLAEAKEFFRHILRDRKKIDESMKSIFNRIKKLKGGNVKAIYSYIIGIDNTNLKGEIFNKTINSELEYIRSLINKLPLIRGGRVCILVYWKNNRTKFSLVFSKDFSKQIAEVFKRVFL